MILNIPKAIDNEFLLKPTIKFDFENPQVDLKETYVNLVETMRDAKGLGLAANQVKIPYSIFVIESVIPVMFLNAEIVWRSEDTETYEEGCLSYPSLFVPIKRHTKIVVEYQDINNERCTDTFTGLTARIVQHEMEHIEGKVFYRNATYYHRQKALKRAQTV